jgi:phosphate transport system substrate-binding protein
MNWKHFLLILSLVLTSCSPKPQQIAVIKIKGSDTMLELTENLAEAYMKKHPGISIYVDGGGTAEGVRALIRGDVDISTASRNLKPDEAKLLAEYYEALGMFFLIAKDALSIYLNPDNPVKNLTIEQLKGIYQGKITSWIELGGKDDPIIPVIRNPNSGTYLYFKQHILEGDDYCEDAVVQATTRSVIQFVEDHINAIGYGGMGFSSEVFHAKIEGIEPSEKNAQNDTYPIARYLHFFTTREPKGAVKYFIDWVLTLEGQKIIRESGFIPLWEVPF